MNAYPGILIVFDGIDGAGKTTQINKIADALRAVGEDVLISKEPTDGQWGQKLRASALSGRMTADEELETFILDRQDHLTNKIIPALEDGKIVFLDRYFYSTIAYQGLRSSDYRSIEAIIRKDTVIPDAAILVDTDPYLAISRIRLRDGKENHFEKLEDLIQIREIFLSLAQDDDLLHVINGSQDIDSVYKDVKSYIIEGALKAKRCFKSYGCDEPLYCGPRITGNCSWWNIVSAINKA
ncbi:dTMP kinase [uncultured Chitinibacter sp.]|uniref:dTMP kinase n=1 Tax=uncultured Chitinibacter sp. TaxID=1214081 RepID=UPI002597E3A4|nr:dTMP kinase [uncultured Chitinibacter sp.]